ncbi:tRNA threonylcarbamoyladenosine dehydratase [Desulfoscipio sp. XC116]|uniref:tRNA threonylcarbamoyladenosine dehydratase n=1 Tax=Desulfoscipio sp. XC116 TaxID=3144975 RepID=UPI00325A988F
MPRRFARTELLIGSTGLEKLAVCKVAIFGLGGVGSFTAEALARSGVGALLLVDHDTVDITNINRQLHAMSGTVGLAKTKVMEERLRQINPALQLQTRQQRFTPDLASDMLDNRALDFVVDAIDDVDNKAALIAGCVERNLPVISAMGAGNKLDPTSFKIDSIWKTSVCPLARVMRKKMRAAGITADVPVVYSTARPVGVSAAAGVKRAAVQYTSAESSSGSADLKPDVFSSFANVAENFGAGAPVPNAVPAAAAASGTGALLPTANGAQTVVSTGSIAFVPSVAGLIMAAFVTDKLLGLGVFPAV